MTKKVAKINDACMNCGLCYESCSFGAINEAGEDSNVEDKTIISNDHYFVNTGRCVGCGRCCNVCPIKNIEIHELN